MLIASASMAVLKTKASTDCTSSQPAHRRVVIADVGGLRGDRDREREVEEVGVVGLEAFVAAGSRGPAGRRAVAVVEAGVV